MDQITVAVTALIDEQLKAKDRLIVAIDGRCASGKTTLAGSLQRHYGCNVIHMDHFFLRPEQRTPERLHTPGENVDHERFLEEVLCPLRAGRVFSYRPFDCSVQRLSEAVEVCPSALTIVEGSYACHSSLWDYYDLHIFLTVDPDLQLHRITGRNGAEKAQVFRSRWIPLEEAYFAELRIGERCEYRFDTGRQTK